MRFRAWVTAALAMVGVTGAAGCGPEIVASGRTPTELRDEGGRLSAAAFFRDAELRMPRISPDGRWVVGLKTEHGVEILVAQSTDGGGYISLVKLDDDRQFVAQMGWPNNSQLVVGIERPMLVDTARRMRQTRLLVVGLDRTSRELGNDWPLAQYVQLQDEVIHWLPEDPGHFLLNYRSPEDVSARAFRIGVDKGRLEEVARAPGGVVRSWAADPTGVVRVGFGGTLRRGGDPVLWVRADDASPFVNLASEEFEFAGFDRDPERLYVWTDDDARRTLRTYHLGTRKLGPKVWQHEQYDLAQLVYSHDGRLVAIAYDAERPELHFLDREAEREQARIDRAFPGTTNRMVEVSRDGKRAVVRVSGDVVAPRYFLYEREKARMDPLSTSLGGLDDVRLSPMRHVTYTARDGQQIRGYLTRPPGARNDEPLPAIVLPHGGPTSRDVWGWQPEVQFLASRGFAVLQPNYRGSAGYGSEFQRMGHQAWGYEMQDDLADAARWLVEQGIADPDRIGIYGGSYGGYAAMMALVKEPELFRAGASFAGVMDLIALVDERDWYQFGDWWATNVGDAEADRERLLETSPLHRVDEIQAPVLIAHGLEDPVVHPDQSRAMIAALKKAGKSVESHLYANEVHALVDERNRIDFYTKLAAFFERHLAKR